mmetsp:Transcript_5325/g.8798  ORF Transcript_5325/g.8798 Transcript_5325/m.8798 type:complete len:104 (-) Transcript_5325:196-507(-)
MQNQDTVEIPPRHQTSGPRPKHIQSSIMRNAALQSADLISCPYSQSIVSLLPIAEVNGVNTRVIGIQIRLRFGKTFTFIFSMRGFGDRCVNITKDENFVTREC